MINESSKKTSPSIFPNNININCSNTVSTKNNTIVLNGDVNFSSLRIENPKKGNIENDVHAKIMLENVPEINEYFDIVDKIGEGTFSKVYKARLKNNVQLIDDSSNHNDNEVKYYALKYIIPIVKPSRIAKELRFLRDLGGQSNIISIKSCFYNNGHTIVVMPIVEHDRFQDYLNDLTLNEIRSYMLNLLKALQCCHKKGIIHRDIKPSNFLYNRQQRQYALVDFGLSQNERELFHSINLSLYPLKQQSTSKQSNNQSSAIRKNLNNKFQDDISNDHNKKLITQNNKRAFDNVEDLDDNATNKKRIKYNHLNNNNNNTVKQLQTSSIFISPLTPSVIKNNKEQQLIVKTSEISSHKNNDDDDNDKMETVQTENEITTTTDSIMLPQTPIKTDQWMYKTPTKQNEQPNLNDVNKTPNKLMMPSVIPETPPRTVQKNFNFSLATPNNCLKNKSNLIDCNQPQHSKYSYYNTPKSVSTKSMNYRFHTIKKNLHQELSPNSKDDGKSQQENYVNNNRLCGCTKTNIICHQCLSKIELNVPRAGTPGFRAPEILLRYTNQSTKIDIWSCGVIFASLLSGRYPFFRCNDDITCLAEIITIFGSTKMKQSAAALGKTITLSRRHVPAMNLKKICMQLKKTSTLDNKYVDDTITVNNNTTANSHKWYKAPDEAYDLLEHLLDPNPHTRFSAHQALMHPFFTKCSQLDDEHVLDVDQHDNNISDDF